MRWFNLLNGLKAQHLRSSSTLVKFLTLAGLVVFFSIDTTIPWGFFAHLSLYSLLVLLAGLSLSSRWVVGVTLASIVLMGLTYVQSDSTFAAELMSATLTNRLLVMAETVVIGGLTLVLLNKGNGVRTSSPAQSKIADAHHSQDGHAPELRYLAETMALMLWTAEPSGTLTYTSSALQTYCGVSKVGESLSQWWMSLLHPEDQQQAIATWTAATQSPQPYSFECRLRRQDGLYEWHLAQLTPVLDLTGQAIQWHGTATNIHRHKQLEQNALDLADRLNATLESITDALFTLDQQWRFTFINSQGERLLQRQRADLLGKVVWEEFPEALGTTFEQQYRKAVNLEQSVSFEEFYPPLETWFEVHAYPSSEGLAVYFQDITDRMALEEQLRQAQRLESMGLLTGGVAHDFNNLLTVILGNAELIAEALEVNSPLRPLADMIGSAAHRGAELTQRLLAFSRCQPLQPQAIDLNQLITNLRGLLQRTLGEHIELEWVQGLGLGPVLIDSAQFESALLNLCLNARDAMTQGGQLTLETANIDLDQHLADQYEVQPGQYVMVAVTDTGIGIPPDLVERVFEPFFTTKETGKGTGLGLSMVYGFIKQSRGHIKIYSELGEGTTVKIYLPRLTEGDCPADHPSDGHFLESGAERILLVEDDDLVRHYGQELLQTLGYRVITAANGPEALDILRQGADIDLLFTDVVMPGGMNGRALADAAQALHPNLKVLYASGYTENALLLQGRLDPGVRLLSKPYRPDELARKVREALRADH